ncbi:hypothetical protein [Candidatus Villigracilis affinis]|uniref:hypothetical protein n=1 Tax=Candidatus Villigracilis affinis TaxID=3140682 RepID=UPI002A19FE45|nr:hypothetical protein [Anaerolineales bacterium]
MRILSLTFVLLCLLTACTSPIVIPTPIPSPTATPQPLTGEWIGTAAKSDGSTASVILNFDEVSPELTIEPLTRKWKLVLKQEGGRISLSTEGRTSTRSRRSNSAARRKTGASLAISPGMDMQARLISFNWSL